MSGPQPDEPNYFVLIAPGADSNDPTPAWVDVSPYLRSQSTRRGADKHLDEDQPGETTVVLDNFAGTWDNDNSGSPYAGQLVTDMRIRILAEWEGDLYERFNGYLDDINLEYPDEAEAWAVLRATDAFKVFAGAELPSSAYAAEVTADGPIAWWRLGDPEDQQTGWDRIGSRNLTYADTPQKGEPLISREANASTLFEHAGGNRAEYAGSIITSTPFTIEAVINIPVASSTEFREIYDEWWTSRGHDSSALHLFVDDNTNGFQGRLAWRVLNAAGTQTIYVYSDDRVDDAVNHHVAVVVNDVATADVKLYVDGEDQTNFFTAGVGAIPATAYKVGLGNAPDFSPVAQFGLSGSLQDVAVYDTALTAARIAAHAEAVATPWNNDTPGQRAHRVLDLVGWPTLLRDIDEGESTLQSAELGMSALDHLLKVAASEFGELHVSKEGALQLRARDTLINRDQLADFGPDSDEVRYRGTRFSSGADLVRNPVTVSRLDGVAQTVEATATYYPHHFTVDGLYHDSDELSRSAAEFLLSEFKDQKRRIIGLTFGPFDAERLADWFPLLLEAELGDVYQVTFHPPNGDDLVQLCVLEGTEESWSAESGIGEISWSLSRAYAGSFWQLGVHGCSELGLTTRLYF